MGRDSNTQSLCRPLCDSQGHSHQESRICCLGRYLANGTGSTQPALSRSGGVVVLATVVFAVWIGLRVGGARVTLWVDDGFTPLAALIACVLCFRARARHGGRMRLFWTLLGCAMAFWTIAEIIWGYYALITWKCRCPPWADVGYLSAIPLAVAALVVHPATPGQRHAQDAFGLRRPGGRYRAVVPQLDARARSAVAQHRSRHVVWHRGAGLSVR